MRIVCVWKDNTDYAREVTDWLSEFKRETGKEVESLDPESTEGEIFVRARDMLQFPAVVALADDGTVLREWKGTPMPQFDEVLYYVKEI
ncbi:hypothetical protein IJG73_02290 [Candidatus Saccharibacteria bacterium]|nr:hypothetical protein [Candidatus Saccharibacteria bacterium]